MPEKQLVSVLVLFYHRPIPPIKFAGHSLLATGHCSPAPRPMSVIPVPDAGALRAPGTTRQGILIVANHPLVIEWTNKPLGPLSWTSPSRRDAGFTSSKSATNSCCGGGRNGSPLPVGFGSPSSYC